MKKQKMSLEKMRGVLSNALSREQMKEVMAGSGGGSWCGWCVSSYDNQPYDCFRGSDGICKGCGRMGC